jgi:roadblock/LC7 domain-containing protein
MDTSHHKKLAIAAVLVAGTSTGDAVAATTSSAPAPAPAPGPATSTDWTPDDCIRLNGGDYNACNVGNSGAGNRPYRPVPSEVTPPHHGSH